MFREVSDLSFGNISEDEELAQTSPCEFSASSRADAASEVGSWKTYTNKLDEDPEHQDADGNDVVQGSAESAEAFWGRCATVRFNTAFEAHQDTDDQPEEDNLPATWAACEVADLAIVAAHLASAALPLTQHPASDRFAEDATVQSLPLQLDDMLGFGTLDLRSCTLNRRAAAFVATQRFGMRSSFSSPAQVHLP